MTSPESAADPTVLSKPENKEGQENDDSTMLSSMASNEESNTEIVKDSLKVSPSDEYSTEDVEDSTQAQPPQSTTEPEEDSVHDSVEISLSDDNEDFKLNTPETLLGQSNTVEEPNLETGEPFEELTETADELPQTPEREPSTTFALASRSVLRRLEETYRSSRSPCSTFATTGTAQHPDPVEIPFGSTEEATASMMPPVMLRMPNTAFGIAMGLAGNSIMWRSASLSPFIADRIDTAAANSVFWSAGIIAGVMVGVAYLYKACSAFEIVVQEYRNAVRIHFMNTPHLALIMLTIGVPEAVGVNDTCLRVVWCIGFACQLFITQFIYERWMFSATANLAVARPQYLLSTVGWFLLAVLGLIADIENAWGLALPSFCFGAGSLFYILVVSSVFGRLHRSRECKGSPSLTLLIAPPSVGVVALDIFDDDPETFSVVAEMLLGWCLVLVLLLLKIGPQIVTQPGVLGMYWAYVFPLSALGSATIRYARVVGTPAAEVMAAIFAGLSTLAVLVVFLRTSYHIFLCCRGRSDWEDPLVKRYEPDERPSERGVAAEIGGATPGC